jgi:carboxypeptidase Taq
MPPSPATATARAAQKAALARAAHAAHTDAEVGNLLARLEEEEEAGGSAAGDPWRTANVREARRAYGKAVAIPEDMAAAKAALESEGYAAWVSARKASDFQAFAPVLERIVEMERSVAALVAPVVAASAGRAALAEPYDALLDAYEKGCTAARLEVVFASLKAGLLPLLQAVREQGTPPDVALLSAGAPFDTAAQAKLCGEIAVALGFDVSAGRLDVSVHPFTGGAGPEDVRMTTRFKAGDLAEGLTGCIHETGHALYEQGRPGGAQTGLPASAALSMGAHESQSLLWERHVGLSLPFAKWLAPRLGAAFQDAFR